MKLVTLLACILSQCTPVLAGTATFEAETNTLFMKGSTDIQLKIETVELIRLHSNEIEEVVMWGGGGSGTQMFVLMKEIHKLNAPVSVPKGKFCASACALVAISSDSLIVRGKLMFHSGHVAAYPMKVTLDDILTYGANMSLGFSRMLYEIGYKQGFAEVLTKYTGPDMWYVVTDSKQLNDCKMTGDTVYEYMETCYVLAPLVATIDIKLTTESFK